MGEEPAERGAQLGHGEVDVRQAGAAGFEEPQVGLLDPGHLVLGVTGGDVVGPPAGDQLLGTEGTQRLEQPVPAAAGTGDE